ncbi:MAG: efflux RND transporter periplasmic adaptor subunit, partial [Telluria sp.]
MTTSLTRFAAFLMAAFLTLPASASPGAHGPNGEHLDNQLTGTAGGLARLPDGSVNVPKLAQRRMAIRTIMAQEGEHPLTVELNGRASMDPNAGGRVQAPFSGRIEPGPNGLPVAGQQVRKGQVLARIRPVDGAIERGNQAAQLADLRANKTLLARRVQRLESLEGTVPAKDIEAAKAELASIVGRERAVAASIGGLENITAPASGVIASASILNGQIVESREVLFDIVDPARMLVEALATDVSLSGRISEASLVQSPSVKLTLLGGARSLRDGALPVHFRASGADLGLAIGQPVTVLVNLSTRVKGIALPAEALARNPANET